jgi:CubicO group peptidase (beta-lactamase class C family)
VTTRGSNETAERDRDRAPQSLQTYLQSRVDQGATPGIHYVAVRQDGIVASCAVGWADVAQQRHMTPGTTLMAYSMSKTVTAIAVLQLVQDGRLALDSPAAQYLPTWPYDARVSVRELLAHTGGLPNPIPLRWVHAASAHASFNEGAALADVLHRHGRQATAPGARFAYSNIGYWLLGAIIERVTGAPFAHHVTKRIFEPLELSPLDAGFLVADDAVHATGYLERWSLANVFGRWLIDPALMGSYEGAWRRIAAHYPNGPAFGGIVGTARAFGRLLQDQLHPHSALLGDAARTRLYEVQSVRGGTPVPMTLGWHVRTVDGATVFYKEGGGGGFRCLMRLCPARGVGSVLMSNATNLAVWPCLDAADRLI